MEIETIMRMLNNSTWINSEKQTIYKFSKDNQLSIDGKNHIQYALKKRNNQIVIKLGSEKKYVVEYVCDFMLQIHGDEEKFMITPT
jgi:hypothetical protein